MATKPPAEPSLGIERPQQIDLGIEQQAGWFRDQYRRVAVIAMILSAVLCLSLLLNVLQFTLSRSQHYFAVTNDLRVFPLRDLATPQVSNTAVTNWAVNAVMETLSLDFAHYRSELNSARQYYLPAAFDSTLSSLKSSKTLDYITQNNLILLPTLSGPAVIQTKGMLGKQMAWQISFPLIGSFESSAGVQQTEHYIAQVLVVQEPLSQYANGIAIRQLVLSPGQPAG